MQPEPLDVVLFFADLGKPYLSLIARMCASVRKQMPHARLVMLTPTPRKKYAPLFDKVVDLSGDMQTTEKTLCYDRVRAMVSWQVLAKKNTAFVDPDIEFIKPVAFDTFDVGLLWRSHKKPDQPVNTGLILAQPGPDAFWKEYGRVVANLPDGLRAWWCDQLGFAIMLGRTGHIGGLPRKGGDRFWSHGALIQLYDMDEFCTVPERATPNTVALHYKGQMKNDVLQFPEKYGASA